ncbi:MAG: putative hydrolase [Candidatus Saccharibacteria bacterium]|nr:putative hydrolase [Candidatus Saccharibacteria bacterium]
MSLEVTIHEAQTSILRELLFLPAAGFAELQKPTGLTSDHFNFHISRLVELGLVERKERGRYRLTPKGKEYANRLDTDNNTVERQPKSAVMLGIERWHDGETQYLFQERLKQPYFGFWGIPTGKIRWGETILECAARELMEETGLQAQLRIAGVYHEHVYQQETGELLEDKIFFVVHCTNARGSLVEEFEGGRNAWVTEAEARAKAPKIFGSFDTELDLIRGRAVFVESRHEYNKENF